VLQVLQAEYRDLKARHKEEEKKLMNQIEEKDKLILTLTKINKYYLKKIKTDKEVADQQLQYFGQRISEI
jgi:hypothetical protein